MSGVGAGSEEAVDYEPDLPALEAEKQAAARPAPEDPSAASAAIGESAPTSSAEKTFEEDEKPNLSDSDDLMSLPPHGTEVFVGGLPKSATEAQVKEFAAQAGTVHSVKLAKDPHSPEQNRGFGFVRYITRESAESAKAQLHETELQGMKVRVSSSQSRHRVYIGNIPRLLTKDLLLDELNKNLKGLESMDLVMSKEAPDQNRGFAFLTFYNHECAAAGKDFMSKPSYSIGGRQLTVSYADPKKSELEEQQHPQHVQQVKAVYVGNLPPGATEENLKEIFSKWGEISKVTIPPATEKRPEQRFGFVHFSQQAPSDSAVADAAAGRKPELHGNILEVKPAKPQGSLGEHGSVDAGHGRQGGGRGFIRGARGGRNIIRGRGRLGRAVMHSRTNHGAFAEQDDAYWRFGQHFDPGYGAIPGGMPIASPAGISAGMTMVPMMLPSGQVGYVLQTTDPSSGAYAGFASTGPDRAYRNQLDHRRGRRGGEGPPRYRPY